MVFSTASLGLGFLKLGQGGGSVLFYLVFLSVILELMPKREPDGRMAGVESWRIDPDYGLTMKNQSEQYSVALKMLPLSPYSCDASVFLCKR